MNVLTRFVSQLWNRSPRENLTRWRGAAPQPQAGPPIWCLSTGRVGTQTLAALGELVEGLRSVHEPAPFLFGLGKVAYQHRAESLRDVPAVRESLITGLEACRPSSQIAQQHYLETSPQVTFLAPLLLELYPESRFIHVVREPAEVIRSGMRRGWYAGHSYDRWRIEPREGSEAARLWSQWNAFEKNLWNWQATNEWIDEFLQSLPADRWLRLASDSVFAGDRAALEALFSFLGSPVPPASALQRVLGQVLNAQRSGTFPSAEGWSEAQRSAVQQTADPLWQTLRESSLEASRR